jgi:hypothetical protein
MKRIYSKPLTSIVEVHFNSLMQALSRGETQTVVSSDPLKDNSGAGVESGSSDTADDMGAKGFTFDLWEE